MPGGITVHRLQGARWGPGAEIWAGARGVRFLLSALGDLSHNWAGSGSGQVPPESRLPQDPLSLLDAESLTLARSLRGGGRGKRL